MSFEGSALSASCNGNRGEWRRLRDRGTDPMQWLREQNAVEKSLSPGVIPCNLCAHYAAGEPGYDWRRDGWERRFSCAATQRRPHVVTHWRPGKSPQDCGQGI